MEFWARLLVPTEGPTLENVYAVGIGVVVWMIGPAVPAGVVTAALLGTTLVASLDDDGISVLATSGPFDEAMSVVEGPAEVTA